MPRTHIRVSETAQISGSFTGPTLTAPDYLGLDIVVVADPGKNGRDGLDLVNSRNVVIEDSRIEGADLGSSRT